MSSRANDFVSFQPVFTYEVSKFKSKFSVSTNLFFFNSSKFKSKFSASTSLYFLIRLTSGPTHSFRYLFTFFWDTLNKFIFPEAEMLDSNSQEDVNVLKTSSY